MRVRIDLLGRLDAIDIASTAREVGWGEPGGVGEGSGDDMRWKERYCVSLILKPSYRDDPARLLADANHP